jgi:hypothetical protein
MNSETLEKIVTWRDAWKSEYVKTMTVYLATAP